MHRHLSLPKLFESTPSFEEILDVKMKLRSSLHHQSSQLKTRRQRNPFALSLGSDELLDFRFAPSKSKRLPPLLPLQHKIRRKTSQQSTPRFGVRKETPNSSGFRLHRRNENAINIKGLLRNSSL
ncbi:unnamed protein product [Blepharisma stoltei]|uniref:Uncharacterized protein n=1 Tax=Blepharisma stoltei TaxID=1481888 RepID=A0AAU9IWN9_9CILI|nr:unnamed protein product [Blepharisma stoltei]